MRRIYLFIFKLALFFAIFIVMDFYVGTLCGYLFHTATGGEPGKYAKYAYHTDCNMMIIGSSKCVHHYNSTLIGDTLDMKVVNYGLGGHGIIYLYGLFDIICSENPPKYLVYDVTYAYDLYKTDVGNEKYIRPLRYFSGEAIVDSIIIDAEPNERFKMLSQMRRYNELIYELVAVSRDMDEITDSYDELDGKIDIEAYNAKEHKLAPMYGLDPVKIKYFNLLIDECKQHNIKLIFALTPYFHTTDEHLYDYVFEVAEKNGIPVISHQNDTVFVGNEDIYRDAAHFNADGAKLYSNTIASESILS